MHNNRSPQRGTTLVEMMVAVGVLALTGTIMFEALSAGMIMFAKNTAVNLSHQEGRKSINRLVRDLHRRRLGPWVAVEGQEPG